MVYIIKRSALLGIDRYLIISLSVLILLQVADVITTYIGLRIPGTRELNPIASNLFGVGGFTPLIYMKSFATVVIVCISIIFYQFSTKLYISILGIINMLMLVVVMNNLSNLGW